MNITNVRKSILHACAIVDFSKSGPIQSDMFAKASGNKVPSILNHPPSLEGNVSFNYDSEHDSYVLTYE